MSPKKPGCLAALFGIRPKPQPRRQPNYGGPLPAISTPEPVSPLAGDSSTPSPYASKGILLSNAETSFFHVLRSMTKDYLAIFPHVALRDLVTVIDQTNYYTHYNKIDRKQVDFVLCNPKTLKPVFVIELDDSSHNRPDRKERDVFVEEVLANAKIPLVRVPVQYNYDQKQLGEMFKSAVQMYVTTKSEPINTNHTIDNPPFCPTHGVRMILRTSRRNGERFWGCPHYPQCRKIVKLQPS